MKELKLILIFCWVILFPLVEKTSDILSVKYDKLKGINDKTTNDDLKEGSLLFIICFWAAGIIFIHFY
jgi:hypothetical protein